MNQSFDHLVFIGRFQPFHQGHHFVVKTALAHAKSVVMLIGSANTPRTIKNPFTLDERKQMILGSFSPEEQARIICVGVNDTLYNDHRWLQDIQHAIHSVVPTDARIGIIGHHKDASSYYLSLFPQYDSFLVDNYQALSATPLRHAYFGDDPIAYQHAFDKLTDSSQAFLHKFYQTPDYQKLKQEYRHIKAYQNSYKDSPYPPSFITADAVVVQSGHILLIERGGDYGKGLYALPGGFVDNNETFLAAAVRELGEETGLNLSLEEATHHLKSAQLFDDPTRSARGRTVTMAYHFELPARNTLPVVTGADDASRAFWLPLHELDAGQMFEDHHAIICQLLKI